MMHIGGKQEKKLKERQEQALYQAEHYKNDELFMNEHKQKQLVILKVSSALFSAFTYYLK